MESLNNLPVKQNHVDAILNQVIQTLYTQPCTDIFSKLNIEKGDNIRFKLQEYMTSNNNETNHHTKTFKLVHTKGTDMAVTLKRLQREINSLTYNYTCIPAFFEIKKQFTMSKLMKIAQSINEYRLPIKCLEAVVFAVYHTCGFDAYGLQRFSISFLSRCENREYRHIILAVHHQGRFGAVGISRKKDLMDKELVYSSVFDLVKEYQKQYELIGHELLKIHLSESFGHDIFSQEQVVWRTLSIDIPPLTPAELENTLTVYQKSTLKI